MNSPCVKKKKQETVYVAVHDCCQHTVAVLSLMAATDKSNELMRLIDGKSSPVEK